MTEEHGLIGISQDFAVRQADGSRLSPEDLHAEGERLMAALLDLEAANKDLSDAATCSDAEGGVVTVELVVAADDLVKALEKFLVVARSAIHAIGGATHDWVGVEDALANNRWSSGSVQLDPLVDA